jgi:hypothetical protein
MNDQTQDPTAPDQPEDTPAETTNEAEPETAPADKPARRRPSRAQLLVAAGSLAAVLVVAGSGFAIGRTTADEGGHRDRPAHGERFDQGGPGGRHGMPPGLPGRDDAAPDAPEVPSDSQDS